MSKEQLIKDLQARSGQKLKLWMKDTIELYQMAGLSGSECVSSMVTEMSYQIIMILESTTEMKPEEFGRIMQKTFNAIVKFRQEDKEDVLEFEMLHPQMEADMLGCIPEFLDPVINKSHMLFPVGMNHCSFTHQAFIIYHYNIAGLQLT